MVKWFLNRHLFELPWESVTNAWWQKYPNPHSLQVDQVDTISRSLDPSTGELITRRLIAASLSPPSWMAVIGFPSHCYVLEEIRVNPISQHMVLKSVNVTGGDLLQIQETCEYQAIKKDGKEYCNYEQSAAIKSFVPIVYSAIESYSLGIHSEKARKGLNAMEELCEKYVKIGAEGFNKVLSLRLDTILLMKDLETFQNINFDDIKNFDVIEWTSKFANDLFKNAPFQFK